MAELNSEELNGVSGGMGIFSQVFTTRAANAVKCPLCGGVSAYIGPGEKNCDRYRCSKAACAHIFELDPLRV